MHAIRILHDYLYIILHVTIGQLVQALGSNALQHIKDYINNLHFICLFGNYYYYYYYYYRKLFLQ